MANTPLLGITQVSNSQANKEVTINDAILALENATNAKKDISFAAAATVTLTVTEATRSFIYIAKAATAPATLNIPVAVNGTPYTRIFAVRNESGQGLTVKFATGAGSSVVIPNNQTRLLAALEGTNIIVAAEPQAAVNFLALSDTPNTFAGVQGKFLGVNVAEDALVFLDAATFPAYVGNAGKYLVVNATEDGVEWVDASVVASFTDLTDAPNSFTGAGGKLVAVKATENGVEFIDPPEAEAVEFAASSRWRVRVVAPGTEEQVGFGEIEFLDSNGFDLTGAGTASAASFDGGREPEFAFDNDLTAGAGWLSDPAFLGENWVAYDFGTPVTVRSVRLHPITAFPGYTPTRVAFDHWNGTEWIESGDRLTSEWVEATPQTFKVAGFPLQSVADAPANGQAYVRKDGGWIVLPEELPDPTGNEGKILAVNATGDGHEYIPAPSGGSQAYPVPFGFADTPKSNEFLLVTVFATAVTFPANFAGSQFTIGANPSVQHTIDIRKNGASVGTITIAVNGAVTFTTAGGNPVSFAPGDRLTARWNATAGTTIINSAFTLLGAL